MPTRTRRPKRGRTEDVEAEYHQPPQPAEAGLGETITLTGTNIGVRLRVTVTGVKRVGDHQAVELGLENTGITNYEGEFTHAAVTYGDGEPTAGRQGRERTVLEHLGSAERVHRRRRQDHRLSALPRLRIRVAAALPARARARPDRGRRDLEPGLTKKARMPGLRSDGRGGFEPATSRV